MTGNHDGCLGVHLVAKHLRKRPESNLIGKMSKLLRSNNSSKPLPELSAPNKEIQNEFAGLLTDEKKEDICIF